MDPARDSGYGPSSYREVSAIRVAIVHPASDVSDGQTPAALAEGGRDRRPFAFAQLLMAPRPQVDVLRATWIVHAQDEAAIEVDPCHRHPGAPDEHLLEQCRDGAVHVARVAGVEAERRESARADAPGGNDGVAVQRRPARGVAGELESIQGEHLAAGPPTGRAGSDPVQRSPLDPSGGACDSSQAREWALA